MSENLSKEINLNQQKMDSILNVDINFDVLKRELTVGEKNAVYYCIDGFVKDDILEKLMEFFYSIKKEDMPSNGEDLIKKSLPYVEAECVDNYEDITTSILSGITCLFIDGYNTAIAIDCRTYPMRSVEEPDKDKALRGSRDGFVETVVSNTALIRRRIRDPKLCVEILRAGECSKTDIVICYMEDRVDEKFLNDLKQRINKIKVDALTMNQQSLAECIYKYKWYNPFPKFKYTERPDTAAASIIDGNIVVLVDNSPSCMILPTSLFDLIEEADDFYFPPITGTYLRISRYLITLVTLILTPTFLLLMQNPEWIPKSFEFINVKEPVNIPLIAQLLILEFAIDGLRLAAINTPNVLSTPLSVLAALVLGEFTVDSGWFNAETMLYMAFVAIASYTQASFELGYALKFMRIITLILTSVFNLYGFILGWVLSLLAIVTNKTISGKSYVYPLIPFNWEQLKRKLIRIRLPHGGNKE